MSASQATQSSRSGQDAEQQTNTRSQRRRMNLILIGIGVFLFAVLVVGMIGIATSGTPSAEGPSLQYNADGSSWVEPPHIVTLWLVITLMDLVAIIAFGIFTAAQNQQ